MGQLLPHFLPPDKLNVDKKPFAFGGYSDVFKGAYAGSEVCVKRLKVDSIDRPEKVVQGRVHHDQLFVVC